MKTLRYLICILLLAISTAVSAQKTWKHGRLRVSADAHFLETTDDRPFFWLGDTGWELFHRLSFEEIDVYLKDRYAKGFNVIQASLIAENEGLKKPNRYGALPLTHNKPDNPNEKYFMLVDTIVRLAATRDMFMALVPAWGDKVTGKPGPAIFNKENAYTYGKWLGNRYKNDENIIWMLGGGRAPQKDTNDWRPIWRAMARGIQEGSDYKAFITYNSSGGEKSGTSQSLHKEPWLNMNTLRSGNAAKDVPVWTYIDHDFKLPNPKPTIDIEPNYEDHPVNPSARWTEQKDGYFDDYDVRRQCYRSVFAGAAGVTYGHHGVWQFYSEREEPISFADRSWTNGLDRPGAFSVSYLRKLIECRPYIGRIYDPSLIVEGQGEKGEFITAFRGKNNDYAMIYMPVGKTIKVKTKFMNSSDVKVWWYDPRIGLMVRGISIYRRDVMEFTPPTKGVGQDWVLILDNPDYQYRPPGK